MPATHATIAACIYAAHAHTYGQYARDLVYTRGPYAAANGKALEL